MRIRVKICGITNLEDALAAIDAGADALGFVFCKASPRYIPPPDAARIVRGLPAFVSNVGLFVDETVEMIRQVIESAGIDTLQLHGDESPEFCREFTAKVIKAFRMKDAGTLKLLPSYAPATWLLDSYVPGKLGGTGERFNWDLACEAMRLPGRVVLAGGLTPENIADAVRKVRPYAVDVSSGVELKPGRKDHYKVRDFIRAATAV